jgi:solute carrier family 25 carnitine/acylcarnitine transporter 20/29
MYTYSKPFWSELWYSFYKPARSSDTTGQRILRNAPISLSSGAFAGVVCCIISCPFEFTKLASQIELLALRRKSEITGNTVDPQLKARSTFQVARDMVRAKGISSLYSGMRYQLARDFIGSAGYFLIYDSFKMGLSELGGRSSEEPAHPASIAVAGAMAGTICWLIVYPLDTYKSVVQRDIVTHTFNGDSTPRQHRTFDFNSLLRRKTYRGLGISLARTSVLGMTFFSCYEKLLTMC